VADYSTLAARPGARRLALAGGLAQLAWGGAALAIVLAVTGAGRSLAVAGLAVGALDIGAALLAPFRGRLVDRHGSGALLPLALTNGIALAGLAVVCAADGAPAMMIGLAAVGGAAAPPVMALARSIWPVVAGPELRRAGHAVNAMLSDLGSALGPALVGVLAALVSANAALTVFALAPLVGSLLIARGGLAARRGGADGTVGGGGRPRMGAGLRPLVIGAAGIAVGIGAVGICAPALARQDAHVELAALPLSGFALTSFVATLLLGRGGSRPAQQLFLRGVLLVAGALALCAAVTSLASFTAVLLVAGVGFGTYNIALLEMLDHVVPAERSTEALTWITSAEGIGLATGSALAGALAGSSIRAGLLVVAVGPALGALVTWIGRRDLGAQGPSTRSAYPLVNERPESSSSRAAAKSAQRG
jgi:MFS family permease